MKTGIQRKQQDLVPCQICGNLYKTGGIFSHMRLKHHLVVEKISFVNIGEPDEKNSVDNGKYKLNASKNLTKKLDSTIEGNCVNISNAINTPVELLIPRKNRYTESDLDVLIKDNLINCSLPEVLNFIQTASGMERSIDRIKEIIFNEGITNIGTCIARLYTELIWPEPQDYDTNTYGYLVNGLHNV